MRENAYASIHLEIHGIILSQYILNTMRTIILFLLLALSTPVWADTETQIRQLEKTLARVQQESQSTYQQFQMIQELLRNEKEAMLPITKPPSSPSKSIPIPEYDEFLREKQGKEDRIKKYTNDLDRLKARYTELESEKQEILEQINLLQQNPEE
jgi:septal ring factor EnvC (AmiA/AmiB activator)